MKKITSFSQHEIIDHLKYLPQPFTRTKHLAKFEFESIFHLLLVTALNTQDLLWTHGSWIEMRIKNQSDPPRIFLLGLQSMDDHEAVQGGGKRSRSLLKAGRSSAYCLHVACERFHGRGSWPSTCSRRSSSPGTDQAGAKAWQGCLGRGRSSELAFGWPGGGQQDDSWW